MVKTDKIWQLFAEYVGASLSIMTESDKIDASQYTVDNPYCLGTALHNLTPGQKGNIEIRYNFPDSDTSSKRTTLNLNNKAVYHRFVIYADSNGKIVLASQDYDENKEYMQDTIYTFPNLATTAIKILGLSTYSGTYAYYDLYKAYSEDEYVEIYDHIEEEYLFTNESNTQSNKPDENHQLAPNFLEFTDVPNNKEVELPFYGIRRTTRTAYAYFKMAYSKNGGAATIVNYSTGSKSNKYRYIKVNLKCDGSRIYVILYTYDKDQQLVERKELSLGTGGNFKEVVVQPLGFYCEVARVHNYKKRVKELFPIKHKYATNRNVAKAIKGKYNLIRDVKEIFINKYNTIADVYQYSRRGFNVNKVITTDVKTAHNTNREVTNITINKFNTSISEVVSIKTVFNTKTSVCAGYKKTYSTKRELINSTINKFNTNISKMMNIKTVFSTKSSVCASYKKAYNTKREVIQSAVVKNTFNVVRNIAKDVKTTFNTAISTTAPVVNKFNTVKLVYVKALGKYDTSREIYAYVKDKYNTKSEVKYNSKIHYNTDTTVENIVRNAYNTVIKTEYREVFKANTLRCVGAKLKTSYNTTAEVIAKAKGKFNTNITVENRVKTSYNTSLEIKNVYRNTFNCERKAVWKVKEKFNTNRDIECMIKARFNTSRELDFLVNIKMLLGITDTSKDPILRYLVFKAIDDMQLNCNMLENELVTSRSGLPLTTGYFPADSMLGETRQLQTILIDLVIYYYQMRGMEHLKSESVEGASWSYISDEIPKQIQVRLKPYKKMRALRVL